MHDGVIDIAGLHHVENQQHDAATEYHEGEQQGQTSRRDSLCPVELPPTTGWRW